MKAGLRQRSALDTVSRIVMYLPRLDIDAFLEERNGPANSPCVAPYLAEPPIAGELESSMLRNLVKCRDLRRAISFVVQDAYKCRVGAGLSYTGVGRVTRTRGTTPMKST